METVKLTYLRARIGTGLSIEEAATQLGVPVKELAAYEQGIAEPDALALVRMAHLYNISIDELIGIGRGMRR